MRRLFSTQRLCSSFGFLLRIFFVAIPKDLWRWLHLSRKNVCGKTVVITGGASGIGKCLAELLAVEHKANIAILDINLEDAKKTVETIRERGGIAEAWKCDISVPDELWVASTKIEQQFGTVDIVICNAAILHLGYVLQFSDAQLQESINVNILGTIHTIRAFVGGMEKRNRGHIVAISSIAGFYGETHGMAYCASKFAIRGVMESVENEMRDRSLNGIQFTTVCPYFTRTPMILSKNMRPLSTWFPFLSIHRCSEEIVDAVLKEKSIVFIPKQMVILAILKGLMSKHVQIAGRRYINCRYEPNSDDKDISKIFQNSEDIFLQIPFRYTFFEIVLTASIAVALCGGFYYALLMKVWISLLLTIRLVASISTVYITDAAGFSDYCSFHWFLQSLCFGSVTVLHLRHLYNKMHIE